MIDEHRYRGIFKELLHILDQNQYWMFDEDYLPNGLDVETVIRHAATGEDSGELQYRHVWTDGRLYLRFPGHSTLSVMDLLLEQPFDPKLSQCKSEFTNQIGMTHYEIANRYRTEYVSPRSDSYTVLSITVPSEFSIQSVRDALNSADKISMIVESLHQEVRQPLRQRTTGDNKD